MKKIIKAKNYLSDYKIECEKYQPIIIIIYSKNMFSLSNNICKALTSISNIFL